MNNAVDLTMDAGFEKLASFYAAGELSLLKDDVDVDMLLEKQAYADRSSFADVVNKKFSIATPVEAYISAVYATKCASDMEDDVIARINEACDLFNIPVEVHKQATVKVAQEQFTETPEASDGQEKYAGCNDYGTELDTCLAARAIAAPEFEEEYEKLASMRDELDPHTMVSVLSELDSEAGLDAPWLQAKVGSPEFAVFEKRASAAGMTIDLGSKNVAIEKIAEMQEYINEMGVDINFDEQDPYAIKLAMEQLPKQIKKAIADIC